MRFLSLPAKTLGASHQSSEHRRLGNALLTLAVSPTAPQRGGVFPTTTLWRWRELRSKVLLLRRTLFPWQPEAAPFQSRDRKKGLYHPELRRGGQGKRVTGGSPGAGTDQLSLSCSGRTAWVGNGLFVFRLNSKRGYLNACMAVSLTINMVPYRSSSSKWK